MSRVSIHYHRRGTAPPDGDRVYRALTFEACHSVAAEPLQEQIARGRRAERQQVVVVGGEGFEPPTPAV